MIVYLVGQTAALLVSGLLLAQIPMLACDPCGPTQRTGGQIRVQWLGWSEFRMTSANGTIIVTNPIGTSAAAADVSPDALAIEKADLILLAGAEDDASLRNTVNLAQ